MKARLTNGRDEFLDITYSHANVHINDSYAVASKDIPDWVSRIMTYGAENGYVYARPEQSWIDEWRAHNLLFKWGVLPSRTKDVDLNESESMLRRFGYFLLSKLYI